jgi:hypothetical protein
MFETAVRKATGRKADTVLEILGHSGILRIEDIDTLPARTGALQVVGINVNVLIQSIKEEYEELTAEPEPDGLDKLDFPVELERYKSLLREAGVTDKDGILAAGVDGLKEIPKIGEITAEAVYVLAGGGIKGDDE